MPKMMNPENMGLLKKTLDTLPDGVLVVAADRSVIYANDKFVDMWGIPNEIMETYDDSRLLDFITHKVSDIETFRSRIEELYESHDETEDELHLTDGRVFLRRGAYHSDAEGNLANIWVFSDITSFKAYERCSLTGLYNRRKFDEDFAPMVSGLRDGESVGIAILDLDNFKQFNDNYGHQLGDYLLTDIGRLLLRRLRRRGDTAYRIGGEEFLLVCQSRTEQHLFNFIESIRRDVLALNCEHKGNMPHGIVTFSAGITFIDGKADAATVFDSVDKAMYAAKDQGRNQTLRVSAQ